MILESLYIQRLPSYDPNPGSYKGEVKLTGDKGNLTVNLTPDLSAKVVALLAESIVSAAKQTSALMVSEVIEQSRTYLLESPSS